MQKIKWPGGDLGYRTPQAFRGWWEIREMLLSVPVKRKVESVTKGKKIKLPQACFVDSKGREEEVDVFILKYLSIISKKLLIKDSQYSLMFTQIGFRKVGWLIATV